MNNGDGYQPNTCAADGGVLQLGCKSSRGGGGQSAPHKYREVMNMKVTINEKAKTLTIELPLQSPPKPSTTGKTLLVATTGGNKESDAVINDQNVVVGVNAYIYATPKGDKKAKE